MKTKKRDSGLKPLAAFGPPGFGFLSAVGTLPNRFSSVSFVAWVGSLLRWVKCNRSKVSGGRYPFVCLKYQPSLVQSGFCSASFSNRLVIVEHSGGTAPFRSKSSRRTEPEGPRLRHSLQIPRGIRFRCYRFPTLLFSGKTLTEYLEKCLDVLWIYSRVTL